MYVCNCNGITEREVRGAIELGCSTLDDLQRELGVAACCGRCRPQAEGLLIACACAAGATKLGHD